MSNPSQSDIEALIEAAKAQEIANVQRLKASAKATPVLLEQQRELRRQAQKAFGMLMTVLAFEDGLRTGRGGVYPILSSTFRCTPLILVRRDLAPTSNVAEWHLINLDTGQSDRLISHLGRETDAEAGERRVHQFLLILDQIVPERSAP